MHTIWHSVPPKSQRHITYLLSFSDFQYPFRESLIVFYAVPLSMNSRRHPVIHTKKYWTISGTPNGLLSDVNTGQISPSLRETSRNWQWKNIPKPILQTSNNCIYPHRPIFKRPLFNRNNKNTCEKKHFYLSL